MYSHWLFEEYIRTEKWKGNGAGCFEEGSSCSANYENVRMFCFSGQDCRKRLISYWAVCIRRIPDWLHIHTCIYLHMHIYLFIYLFNPLNAGIDPFNMYRIRNFHPMTLNSFQFYFWILLNLVYCLRLIKTINVIEKNSKGKLKRIWRHWVKMTYSVLTVLKGSIQYTFRDLPIWKSYYMTTITVKNRLCFLDSLLVKSQWSIITLCLFV